MKRCAERKTSSTNYRKAMSKIFTTITTILLLCSLVVPSIALAATFNNPLRSDDPADFIGTVIDFLLGLVFVLALLALVVGGVRMVASFGNEQSVASAKKIILWAIVGLTVVIMSWVIIRILVDEILQAG